MNSDSKKILDVLISLIQVGDSFLMIPRKSEDKLAFEFKVSSINMESIEVFSPDINVQNKIVVVPKKFIDFDGTNLFCKITSKIYTRVANNKVYLMTHFDY